MLTQLLLYKPLQTGDVFAVGELPAQDELLNLLSSPYEASREDSNDIVMHHSRGPLKAVAGRAQTSTIAIPSLGDPSSLAVPKKLKK